MFAEFLPFLLVFPCGHTSVGLTSIVECFSSCLIYYSVPSWTGVVNGRWLVRSDIHLCSERSLCSLITHISIVTHMWV